VGKWNRLKPSWKSVVINTCIASGFENFRKRTQRKEDLEQQVKRNTITELLPVVDNFERAIAPKPQTDAELSIHKSYQSVYKQLVDCLKRLGISNAT